MHSQAHTVGNSSPPGLPCDDLGGDGAFHARDVDFFFTRRTLALMSDQPGWFFAIRSKLTSWLRTR
ncbi:hypothetical protein CK221_25695 [Mesorhizobium sp. WSM3868]|nr:hypothetical protein CK221_25695 [Mesorhizobium sp. WSM3868]